MKARAFRACWVSRRRRKRSALSWRNASRIFRRSEAQENRMTLKGKTLFITGASRGIGLAIGKRAAADGANVVIAAKTTDPNPKLPGTIYSAADDIRAAGGQ